MAGGFVASGEVSKQYNGRVTLFVILSCMVAGLGGVLFGYDIGISGGVTSMPAFLMKFFPKVYRRMREDKNISNYCKFDSQLLTAFTSSLYLASLIACFFASYVTRIYGRKPSIIVGGAAFVIGSVFGGAAVNIEMLIIGRILLGIGVGFANQSVPLYLSEMAPAKYRGAINNGFQLSTNLGVLSANLINYGTEKIKGNYGWRLSLAMAAFPALIFTIGSIFLPETPNSLIQRGSDFKKAKIVLQKVRGTVDVQAELDDLIEASSVSKTANQSHFIIFEKRYRPQLVMAIAIPFFQQVTGINVIAFYAPLLFITIGFGTSAALLSSVLIGVIATTFTIVSMFIVDKFGRRALFIVGGIQMFMSQIIIGSVMANKLGDHTALMTKSYAYFVLVFICVYVCGYSWSWGPLGWLVPSEIFPLEIRSAGQTIVVSTGMIFTFIIAQTFLTMLCHLKAGIFFFFGGWVFVMTVFVYFFLPETKGIPIEQMARVWREHWFWKRFVGGVKIEAGILRMNTVMDGGIVESGNAERPEYNGRVTRFVILSCMMAGLGGILFGYDIGISGGVSSMAPFLMKFFPGVYRRMIEDKNTSNYCKFDSQYLTAFTSVLYLFGLFACWLASTVTRVFGRKCSILVGGTFYVLGTVLGATAPNLPVLLFGRALLGVGVGFANQSVPLYLSEMAPAKYRGAINNGFQLSTNLGVLLANFVNFGTQKIKGNYGWRVSLAMAAVPALIFTIGSIFLPDTPNSLIHRGKDMNKAKMVLQKVRGTADVQAEMDDLVKASSASKTTSKRYFKILERRYRPQLVMAIAIPLFQQFTGINVVAFYAPLLFITIGFGTSAALLSAALISVIATAFTIVSMFIVDKVGRRTLFIVGGIQMFISQMIIGGVMANKLGDHTALMTKGYASLVLVFVCIYICGYSLSWGPLAWLVPSEIFPLEIRSAGQTIVVSVGMIFTIIIAQTFLAMLCHLKAVIFFFFGGWVFVMTVFVYFFLPETKNIPMEQMVSIWREHWFWKRFVGEEERFEDGDGLRTQE
ncbi:hypothetical protein MKW92_035287 [Papaver armeniacum]|nr:hypothetical protein MKW92_035287 [Papaver armeniacum]